MVLSEIEIEIKEHLDGVLFRGEPVAVKSVTQKVHHKGVFFEQLIIDNLKVGIDILNKDNKQISNILRIAVFHYYFGYIHHFCDGNGRLSRFISSYLLAGLGLSGAIKNDIHKYYESFKIANDGKNKGDSTHLATHF